jgi:hypothetical protein
LTWTHPYPTNISIKSTGPRVFINRNLSDFYLDSCQDLALTRTAGYVTGRIVRVIFVWIAVLFPWLFTGISRRAIAGAGGKGITALAINADIEGSVRVYFNIPIVTKPRPRVRWGGKGGQIRGISGRIVLAREVAAIICSGTKDSYACYPPLRSIVRM